MDAHRISCAWRGDKYDILPPGARNPRAATACMAALQAYL
jgi:hypothetical protein